MYRKYVIETQYFILRKHTVSQLLCSEKKGKSKYAWTEHVWYLIYLKSKLDHCLHNYSIHALTMYFHQTNFQQTISYRIKN